MKKILMTSQRELDGRPLSALVVFIVAERQKSTRVVVSHGETSYHNF